ncbi:GH36-type glycosyl hydrolase domain-containing protein [Falsiroseomonas sp. E2-1-a4]|uniref:GH36-type glycosyl hydrolase domain-containing protein n=1 Tax=Falsiroseomonas sp. E2-1-a4 TaxID=3239299 RepID=UPI003F3CAB84
MFLELLRPAGQAIWNDTEPVRAEIFGIERLEMHGKSLAASQTITTRKSLGDPLGRRLADNATHLLECYIGMVQAVDEARPVTPATEWLIDNFHLVERQIRAVHVHLPPRFYRQLPKLANGPFAGYPRVFSVAWAYVAHTDSSFNPTMFTRYLRAYQTVQPLTIGELWASSITLRIVLIENLRRLAQRMLADRLAEQEADRIADRLLDAAGTPDEPASALFAGIAGGPIADAFAVQLVHRLRDQDPSVTPALAWLDQRLEAQGTTADAARQELQRSEGAANVTVRNIITSLRLIADVNWNQMFESVSLVDDVLAAGSTFVAMDFATRNLYRSAIEELSARSSSSEIVIARSAVAAAQRSPDDPRKSDPGYYLLAGGRRDFEIEIGFRPPFRAWPKRLNRALGIGGYASAVVCTTLILLALALYAMGAMGLGWGWLVALAVFGMIPAQDLAVSLMNRVVTTGFGARLLPGLELLGGVPPELRTMVVVPTLLTSVSAIDELVERLEVHYLVSPAGCVHFALLTDWTDAPDEQAPDDEALLAAATAGIAELNRRVGPGPDGDRFFLLHRRRVWNAGEACWMGWERKRGKLHEFNRLLRGAVDTNYIAPDGHAPRVPVGVRYVITLDADTRLPRDTVRRLIGKMAHPLNQPRLDTVAGRVVEGYAVLQPRVTPSQPIGTEGSAFQRIFSSVSGMDPYALTVSDVYQDLFGEGSYAGKGIYEVDAFEASLAGRVPDSTLLSHDLFEGVYARSGLASDVEVVEEFPSRYDVGAQRHHRWARGDWQLLPWILGRKALRPAGHSGTIPAIGRWKMIDNLRRSSSAPAAVLALLVGWMLPSPAAALVWTLLILATIALPTLLPVVAAILPWRKGVTLASHTRALAHDLATALAHSGLLVTFLAHQAWLMGDAIARTLWRLFASHRHLLQWVPSAEATRSRRLGLGGSFHAMSGGLVVGGVAGLVAVLSGHWLLAGPFALLWWASPAVARWASSAPRSAARLAILPVERQALRLTARRTWRFFETFVTAADNMLPPDNFQEDPEPALARRTSPTNIGLYLLSVVSARDFGWIGTVEAVDRLEATLATMARMERCRGHFYNWYDTGNLRPLDPKYISSVDSGNLAGHLIALANACRQLPRAAPTPLIGIVDAIELAREETARLNDGHRTQTTTWRQLDAALAALGATIVVQPERDHAVQADLVIEIAQALAFERGNGAGNDLLFWVKACRNAIRSHRRDHDLDAKAEAALDARLAALAETARAMAMAMEFGFLLDTERTLLSIGYLVPEDTLDPSCYDLLASEARLASFFAIAKGDVPARHWFRLGRAMVPVAHSAALLSWSGSMFEYLMPSLVMRAPGGSLLEQTNRLAVRRQMEHAAALQIPWGISESAYNARDLELTYQYSNFGVPNLGLKRGLSENSVIAPYATALAAMVDPRAACANLARLAQAGARGRYGFYEAIDYTRTRLPKGAECALVRAYMAHHQGMTIVALATALDGGLMRRRFHAEPMVQATELLLHERMPREVASIRPFAVEVRSAGRTSEADRSGVRHFTSAQQATPATHLLSNGRLTTMLTAAGSGYMRWGDIAVTRWREDATCDDSGSYIYLRDVRSGRVWSAGAQPTGARPDSYGVTFHEDRAEFTRSDGTLTTTVEILVSSENDAEVRRVSLANTGTTMREIDVTSYAELALARPADDIAHPAFSKLFIETEYVPELGALLATRRKRGPDDPGIWAAHLSVVEGVAHGAPQFETDRARFLGRGHGVSSPAAMAGSRDLSGTVGTVLDPVFALRRRIRVAPGAVVRVALWTMVAPTREALLDIADQYRDAGAFSRAATLAWTQAQVQMHHLGIAPGTAALFQHLAGHLVHAAPTMRASSETICRGGGPQSGLWPQGISGDLPILLLRIDQADNLGVARELLRAFEYWRAKQLAVDIVFLNDRQSSYTQDLQEALEALVRTSRAQHGGEPRLGRVYVLRADLISAEARALLGASARVVLVARRGGLADQIDRISPVARDAAEQVPRRLPAAPSRAATEAPTPPSSKLELFNGLGGFDQDGREYVTLLGPGQSTPAPWINVVSNPHFGFHVPTEGGGFTWAVNSRENQITPWSNDPVSDRPGEAFYLRDEETGAVWTPTALPIRDEALGYVARHGRGYSRFEHEANGIRAELTQSVPLADSIKISRLLLTNRSGRARRLSVTAYVEWVLGPSRTATLPFVTTAIDSETGAMFARNPWNIPFGTRVAFLDLRGAQTSWTGDRREFIGSNGSLADPAGVASTAPLSNTVGGGLDPCGAMQSRVTLPAHGSVEIVCFLGQAADAQAARALVTRYRAADLDAVAAEVTAHWDDVLGRIQVRTPDRPMDIMLNGWLLYQALSCRVWARAGFYQASGAYGFRDQLQDGMALVASRPAETRAHLLRAASRQFVEGDVQHWWLPHSGQGVRTRISDDRGWLALAVDHYITATGDAAILDEQVPFLEGAVLAPGEHERFFQPEVAETTATLFEHCARALDQSMAVGRHGLPLMGTGDWNDGMNRVGEKGEGESVWLGWMLHSAFTAFRRRAAARGDVDRVAAWQEHASKLQSALEREAWDGDWYRRAFYDDGTPLGSAAGTECRIDSIAQSWAVLSGAADPVRAEHAMASAERELIRPAEGLALLFTPPFDQTTEDPGYIKAYPPGVRENGGQYTHAGLWLVMAFAALGKGSKAGRLFAMMNPINHARTRSDVHRYKVEPYVVAADISATPPHVGRGGWTWYTGSSGWMQRAGIESILGLRLQSGTLLFDPCIPADWPGFEVTLRHGTARYEIRVENPEGVERGIAEGSLDGEPIGGGPLRLQLVDDGASHRLFVRLGLRKPAAAGAVSSTGIHAR